MGVQFFKSLTALLSKNRGLNRKEVDDLLREEESKFKRRTYASLMKLRDAVETFEKHSPSGRVYDFGVEAFIDNEEKQHLRVQININLQNHVSVYRPISVDFIISPNGSFVGE